MVNKPLIGALFLGGDGYVGGGRLTTAISQMPIMGRRERLQIHEALNVW